MAAAGDYGKSFTCRRDLADLNRQRLGTFIRTPCPQACASDINAPIGRHRYHPKHHAALLDQGDVDGELLAARDEFLGPVQRIDQPPALPAGAHALGDVGVFFREHRDAWVQSGQPVQNQMVSRQVSGCDG